LCLAITGVEVTPEMESYARWYIGGFLSPEDNTCKPGKKIDAQWYCPQYTKKVNKIMKLTQVIRSRRAEAAAQEAAQPPGPLVAPAPIVAQNTEF
jgi:hypothetical protein